MASIIPKTFSPILYDLQEVEISAQINASSTAEKVASVYIDRIPKDDPDYFIKCCKHYDAIYGLAVKNSDFERGACERYVLHLADLHRFDETYQFGLDWLNKKPDEDLAKKYLFDIAIVNDNLEEAKKYIPERIEADSSFDAWMRFIIYHSVNGTIHEIAALGPHPQDKKAQLMLAAHCDNQTLVYELFKNNPDLNSGCFKWPCFTACTFQNDADEVNSLFEEILKELPPWISFHHFERVIEQLMRRIKNVNPRLDLANKIALKRPLSITARRILAVLAPETNKEFLSDLKKLSEIYACVPLKRIAIQASSLLPSGKAKILSFTIQQKPDFYLIRDIAEFNATINKKLKTDTYRPYAYLRPLFRQAYVASFYESIDKTNLAECDILLKEIEDAIRETPHYVKLHSFRLYLLNHLKRFSEGDDSIAILTKAMRYYQECGKVLFEFYNAADLHQNAIDVLQFQLKYFPNANLYHELNNALIKHGTLEKHIIFLIENHNFDVMCADLKKRVKEVKDFSPFVEVLKNQPRFSEAFIKERLRIYSELKLFELALEDCEWLCSQKIPVYHSKFILLASLGRVLESTEVYLSGTFEISENEAYMLIAILYESKHFDIACKVFEKSKSPCNKSKLVAANSYLIMENWDRANLLANQLYKESPHDAVVLLIRAEAFFNKGGLYGTVIDICKEALALPNNECKARFEFLLLNAERALSQPAEDKKTTPTPVPSLFRSQKKVDPSKVTFLIEDPKTKKRDKVEKVKEDKANKHLQESSAKAVDPLADPLAKIKEIARIGETQTGPKPKESPAPAPVAAPIHAEAPKPIVKLHLTPRAKVFIKKGADALNEVFNMKEALLEPDDIFYNRIYAILRAFIPLRLNSTHSSLINDLKRIRDNARHDSDQISHERLTALFTYLKSISLVQQMNEWIREKSIITRLMLNNHVITVRKPKKTPLEKAIAALEYIVKKRGDKATWNDRLYHRNGIKACVSIIGEASNFMPQDQKALLAHYRENGTVIAHDFFEDGDTVAFLEKYKEEDISQENLWDLTDNAEILLKALKSSS